MMGKCTVCGTALPAGDTSQIFCSLTCQIKRDPIDESILTDEQLEIVIGGMSPQSFARWRVEVLNEDR